MKSFPAYQINQHSREEIVETLKRIHEKYPAVFEHFFMYELRQQQTIISKEDMEYFKGTPAPLKIIVPNIVIEEDDEDKDSR